MKKRGVLYRVEYRRDGFRGVGYWDVFADGGETHADIRKHFHTLYGRKCIIVRIGTKKVKDSSTLFPAKKQEAK